MSNENNKFQIDIENLFKQNVNDLTAIKELYRRIEELGEKIIQIKYIDNTLVKKIKKEYENLKKVILDENVQVELKNKIEETKNEVSSQLDTKASKDEVDVERKRIDSFISLPDGSTSGDAELIDGRIGVNGTTYENIGTNIREIAKGKAILNNSLTPKKFNDNLYKLSSELLFTDLTLTDGYYLDPNDGAPRVNVEYGYTDFIAVEPSDIFYCTDTSGLYCKYNYNKELLGGGSLSNNSDLTMDSNTYYIKLSIPLNLKELIKFKKYKFYINARNVLRNLTYYVDKNGNGDFTKIQDAINMIPNNGVGTVYINDGEYEETLECWGKTVHLIGMSKKGCIVFNYNDDYANPPLEIGRGSVQNMTIKSINKTDKTTATAYGIHIEDNNLFNGSLQIINCRIESGHNYAIGMGLRGGCDVEFNNCELIGKKVYGGLYFHDAINPEYKGEQNITIKNCVISSQDGGFLMRIQSQNVDGSTINMEFINNIIKTPVSPDYQGMHFANDKTHESTTKPTDFNILTNFKLSPMSYGNNIDLFNY